MMLGKSSATTIRQFSRKRFLFSASSVEHRRASPQHRGSSPVPWAKQCRRKTAPDLHPVLSYFSSALCSCRCMGICCSTVRISSSRLAKDRRSPESGKYTVPCHSCLWADVTAISNRGVCFMLCTLLFDCIGEILFRLFCFLILPQKIPLFYYPFQGVKWVMPAGSPAGIALFLHCSMYSPRSCSPIRRPPRHAPAPDYELCAIRKRIVYVMAMIRWTSPGKSCLSTVFPSGPMVRLILYGPSQTFRCLTVTAAGACGSGSHKHSPGSW